MNNENATVAEAVVETPEAPEATETETVVMQQANQPQTEEDAPKAEAEAVTEVIEEKASSKSDPEA